MFLKQSAWLSSQLGQYVSPRTGSHAHRLLLALFFFRVVVVKVRRVIGGDGLFDGDDAHEHVHPLGGDARSEGVPLLEKALSCVMPFLDALTNSGARRQRDGDLVHLRRRRAQGWVRRACHREGGRVGHYTILWW